MTPEGKGTPMLDGQVAILTGAAGGIGRGVARRLAADGARLVLVDRDMKGLENIADSLVAEKAEVVTQVVDLTDGDAIGPLVDSAFERFGRVDILINNAGTSAHGRLVDVPREVWDRELAVHMTAPFLLLQEVARSMIDRGYGRIVNVSSVAALMGPLDLSPYGAAKSGLAGITRAAATELAEAGITVNAVALGPIATDLLRATWPPEQLAARAEHLPVRRLGEVEDAVNAILFFCSPATGFVTGTVLPVDGGSVAAGAYMVEQYRRWHADN